MSRLSSRRRFTPAVLLLLSAGLVAGCTDVPTPTEEVASVDRESGVPIEMEALLFPALKRCEDGELSSGALYLVCRPLFWNRSLVVWAPGYANPFGELQIRDSEIDGRRISDIVTGLGYAFATTSFRTNGLVGNGGRMDLVELTETAEKILGRSPRNTYLVGASNGGLVGTRTVESRPDVFSGGFSLCAPIGSFGGTPGQMFYFGSFRVVFDYFFADVLPPPWSRWTAGDSEVPQALRDAWDADPISMQDQILAALAADPSATRQLLRVTGAAVDPGDLPTTAGATVLGVLWYHVFGTNDALDKLGGQPFQNSAFPYTGSDDDEALNAGVERFTADQAALDAMAAGFETTGALDVPLVTLHTTLDPIVPAWQQTLYRKKVNAAGNGRQNVNIAVSRYGHCAFTIEEVLAAFAVLVFKVKFRPLFVRGELVPGAGPRGRLVDLARDHGAPKPVFIGEGMSR